MSRTQIKVTGNGGASVKFEAPEKVPARPSSRPVAVRYGGLPPGTVLVQDFDRARQATPLEERRIAIMAASAKAEIAVPGSFKPPTMDDFDALTLFDVNEMLVDRLDPEQVLPYSAVLGERQRSACARLLQCLKTLPIRGEDLEKSEFHRQLVDDLCVVLGSASRTFVYIAERNGESAQKIGVHFL